MKHSIFFLVLLILISITQSGNLFASQLLSDNLQVLQEVEIEMMEELDTITNIFDKKSECTDSHNGEEKKIEEENIEEQIEIIKFKIDGLMLKEGIISEDVLRLKKFLIAKGYEGITEDYNFDQKTREIIIDYQRKNGLVPDGIVGINTFTKINEDMEQNKLAIPENQLIINTDKEDMPEGNFIVINKDNNTLYHLNNKQVVSKYPVATGKEPRYTPEGKFTIVSKFINPVWGGAGRQNPIKGGAPNNPLGKRWMGLSIGNGRVYGIHGNSDKNSIGRYVSLGCVRMFNEDVEILYDLVDYGTPVWIGTEEKLKEFGILFDYTIPINVDIDI